jgi:hypothetical protein
VFLKTGGNLLTYLYRYAPILKDRSFEEEREWRIISRPIFAQRLDYREGRSLIIPYYQLPLWEDGQKTEIHEIVVGPTRDVERSIKSVSRLVRGRNVIKDRNLKGLDLIKEGWGYTPLRPRKYLIAIGRTASLVVAADHPRDGFPVAAAQLKLGGSCSA